MSDPIVRRRIPVIRRLRIGSLRLVALILPLVLVATVSDIVTEQPEASAAPAYAPTEAAQEMSTPGRALGAEPRPTDPDAARALRTAPAVVWPAASSAEVVPAAKSAAGMSAGVTGMTPAAGLPIAIGDGGEVGAADVTGAPLTPARVRVEVLDRARTARAGVDGLLTRVERSDSVLTSGSVRFQVDYTSFRHAYGADWSSRLRLVTLPECALSAPDAPACQGVPLRTANSTAAGTATAEVRIPARGGVLVALAASESGGAGDFAATSLAPSATWQAGGSTGDFSWSYGLRTPPAAGGPAPSLSLAYSSGSVDGRTASTNNQPSWVGEGFDMGSGFIERKYVSCAEDVTGAGNPKTGDQCWGTNNATMSLNGRASELVRDDATGVWRPRNDDGSRVERLTGAVNGDNDGEYWKVTTLDGTQYWFGRHRLPGWVAGKPETKSTWTVPVFGNHSGEACHQATFAASWCQQAWRWNLDHVVDPHGNSMSYFYETEINHYGRNLIAADETPYVRAGYLTRIDYGQRNGSEYTSSPMRVTFAVDERCIPGGSITCAPNQLTTGTAASWPDVPFDNNCNAGAACTGQFSPSFWTRKKLASVTTAVWTGTAYRDVDTWTLRHTFPDPGDGTSAALWLDTLTHTGKAGTALNLPAINFDGVQLTNRVDALEGLAPINRLRMSSIYNETGGALAVNYAPVECVRGVRMPTSPDSNTLRCFPSFWTPEGQTEPTLDWFHKYVVAQVVSTDNVGGAPSTQSNYEYVGGAAWHWDDEEFTLDARRTWGQWRGYAKVRTRDGAAGPGQTFTETLFLRGMDEDKLAAGGTKNVVVTDSEGGTIEDHWRYAGLVRETIQYNGAGGPVVAAEISDPSLRGPTATRARPVGPLQAFLLDTGRVRGRAVLQDSTVRRVEVVRTFDDKGLPTQIDDLGDTSTSADDRCTRYTYARNTATWLLNYVSRVETVGVGCAATPSRPADVVSDVRTYHDGATVHGTVPTRGTVTRTEDISGWSGSSPTYATSARAVYDALGRVVESYDATGAKTTTAYTPSAGGPVTGTTVTNVLGHAEAVTIDPAWGEPTAVVDANGKRTDAEYDALGRRTKVWLPGRSKSGGATPNQTFAYLIRTNGPSAVSTASLRDDGSYMTSHELYDGQLRLRQTQLPAAEGGRVLTDM
ncbi:MAG: type IV secretion protein Rhs, partial [Pseudonocardia sp.]|nr:type IV secretion protein Rhs [Pseudonocardia sp.]